MDWKNEPTEKQMKAWELLVGAMSQTTYERVESVGRDMEITKEDIKNEEHGID